MKIFVITYAKMQAWSSVC